MVKNHLKRIAIPKTWEIMRKTNVFVSRPNPGAHSNAFGMSLNTLMKEIIGCARTTKEVKRMLHKKFVLVDGRIRHDEKFNVGFMDSISFPSTKESYRVSFTKKGKLTAFKIPEIEANQKLIRIINKKTLPGEKTQLTCGDGRTIIVDKDVYKSNDVLHIELPSQKIKSHLQFKKGASALIVKGKYAGFTGVISEISDDKLVTIKTEDGDFHTKFSYVFITGDKKPVISVVQ